ncbi:hypothetical protein N658DRAFT_483263 [Parathielavia hyrcaniae]|uniref:Aminoglycoside phosphotransferase domain-containing protein n=1 Tax=Parathielavia hyrcaniae TaxID=113614 RepID=A0AAN6QEA5_9PEZI|nr:hypothetical protein N658DRAFT_483263 [Parathielavia hyrcaniae]
MDTTVPDGETSGFHVLHGYTLGSTQLMFESQLDLPICGRTPRSSFQQASSLRSEASRLPTRNQHLNFRFRVWEMMTEKKGLSIRCEIDADRIEEERDRWVAGLDENEVCRLASSHRSGDKCSIFQPRKYGSFNVCFFVKFDSPFERWVVRIPTPATLFEAMLDEETEIEVATMRYVSAKTTIPIPKVHTYALSPTGLNGMPYIIMDYVNGHNLKDLNFGPGEIFGALQCAGAPQTPVGKHLYRQLADVYVQLRQLESPRVGALGPPSHGASVLTCDPEEISVCHRPLSMDMAMQEVDSLEPGLIFPPKSTLSTAKDYVNGLLMLADNNLEKETEQGIDERKPESILYAAHHFRRFVENEWLDPSANQGPFDLTR